MGQDKFMARFSPGRLYIGSRCVICPKENGTPCTDAICSHKTWYPAKVDAFNLCNSGTGRFGCICRAIDYVTNVGILAHSRERRMDAGTPMDAEAAPFDSL